MLHFTYHFLFWLSANRQNPHYVKGSTNSRDVGVVLVTKLFATWMKRKGFHLFNDGIDQISIMYMCKKLCFLNVITSESIWSFSSSQIPVGFGENCLVSLAWIVGKGKKKWTTERSIRWLGFSSCLNRLYLEFFETIGNLYIYQRARYVTKAN